MIDSLIIIGCIIVGILLLLIEFTILPGITIAGIGAVVLFLYSIFLAYTSFGIWGAVVTALCIMIGTPLFALKLFKGKAGKSMRLEHQIEGKVETQNYDLSVGQQGVTLTRMGPIGNIRIGEKELEAKSTGTMIDAGQNIEIIQIDHNQIIVKEIKTTLD